MYCEHLQSGLCEASQVALRTLHQDCKICRVYNEGSASHCPLCPPERLCVEVLSPQACISTRKPSPPLAAASSVSLCSMSSSSSVCSDPAGWESWWAYLMAPLWRIGASVSAEGSRCRDFQGASIILFVLQCPLRLLQCWMSQCLVCGVALAGSMRGMLCVCLAGW